MRKPGDLHKSFSKRRGNRKGCKISANTGCGNIFHSLFVYERTFMRKIISILLCLAVMAGNCTFSFAESDIQVQIEKTVGYLLSRSSRPGPGDQGGDWVVMGLARSGLPVPEDYFQTYYDALTEHLEECGGVLSSRKYTEYSRTVTALSALGADPSDVGGYDLLAFLADFNAVKWQGLNGPVWALIALDSRGYEISENSGAEAPATRQMYVDQILSMQLEDGGFNLSGKGAADPDMTGMALQALAKYRDRADVAAAVDEALACLMSLQKENGQFESSSNKNCESLAQVIVALCELGYGPEDPRFVRGGKSLADVLLNYALPDGSFEHYSGSGSNQMATEQAFYALVAAERFINAKTSLYDMSDAEKLVTAASAPAWGLSGKNADIRQMPVTDPDAAFSDIASCGERDAVLALASRGIISGMGDGTFRPTGSMTRAQFAAIVTRALGLTAENTTVFRDIAANAWYAGYIGTANKYGIVNGRSADVFDPESGITKQEAAVMLARAAALCGLDTEYGADATRNALAPFADYTTAAAWAQPALAFCYYNDILDQSELDIAPLNEVTRAEIAQMTYNMLDKAKLL